MRATALAGVCVLLVAVAPAAAHEEGHAGDPALEQASFDPVPGDYTMRVRVRNFDLVPPNASQPDRPGEGHIVWLLNDFPCAGECARGASYQTTAPAFTYRRLVVGDYVTAVLVHNSGFPVLVTHPVPPNTTDEETGEPITGNVTVPVFVTLVVNATATVGPHLGIVSGIPNAGDYTMRLRVERFTLVQPGTQDIVDPVDTGFVRYSKNGVPCGDACGPAAGDTASTQFTFEGVKVGDRLSAELMRWDDACACALSLERAVQATTLVAAPRVTVVSGPPQEGVYTMRVRVTGFTLNETAPANAGTGHVVYLVERNGPDPLRRGPLEQPTGCGDTATDSTNFTYCELEEGERLVAQLVSGGRVVAASEPLEVSRAPREGMFASGLQVFAVVAVALVAARLRRR
jgi:hypothetical protein